MPALFPARQPVSAPRRNFQRLFAKWPLFASIAAALALLGPSCVPDPYYGGHHHPPSGSSANSAYNAGHADGRRDRDRGRRYDPHTGQHRYPPALRENYVNGYRAGYQRGGNAGWTQRKAYDDGFDHGRRDKISGRSRNPGRHLRDVPGSFQREFSRGYHNGWNQTAVGRPPGPLPRPPRPVPY